MERLERESACEDLKAGAERITANIKTVVQRTALKFKWSRPLYQSSRPDVLR